MLDSLPRSAAMFAHFITKVSCLHRGYVGQDALQWSDKIDIQQALLNGTTRDALASGHPFDQGQDETTLAEALSEHHSAFIGKWHLGGHGSQGWQPKNQGFQEISYFDEGGSPYFNWRGVWDRRRASFPENATTPIAARQIRPESTARTILPTN